MNLRIRDLLSSWNCWIYAIGISILISGNENNYIQLIRNYIEHSSDLRQKLLNIYKDAKSNNEEFKRMISKTGITEQEEKKVDE